MRVWGVQNQKIIKKKNKKRNKERGNTIGRQFAAGVIQGNVM